jgi:hypothetical protein
MAEVTTGVFVTQETDTLFFYHFNKCNLSESIKVINDTSDFINIRMDKKIACLQMPYPLTNKFVELVDTLVNHCDHVLILVSELHDKTLRFIREHDISKISYFICGDINLTMYNSPVHKFYDWFTTSVHFYKHVKPNLLNTLNPYKNKSNYFDILLGRKKLHRDVVYNSVAEYELFDNNIVTYINDINCDFNDINKWLWEKDGLEIDKPVEWTVDRLPYYGHRMSLSQIVPLSVYNNSCYSVIAETNWNNEYSFYTEKTVKPILGRRLFVMVAGRDYLRNLQNLGFRTFGTVVDESYDNEKGDIERFKLAVDQVRYLCTQPQEEILAKIKPICDQNYNVMMSVDWYNDYFKSAFVGYFNR